MIFQLSSSWRKRNSILVIILFFSCVLSVAQTKYRGFAEVGYGAFVGGKSGSEYQASTSHGVLLNHVFIGGGLGVDYYSVNNKGYDPDHVLPEGYDGFGYFGHIKRFTGVSVPVFLNVKGLWEDGKVSPNIDFKTGITAGFAAGLFGEIGAGCRIRLKERRAILLNVFYKYAFEPGGLVTDDSDYMEGAFSNIGLKMAVPLLSRRRMLIDIQ